MPTDARLSGFRELSAALGELKKSTERSVLRRVATKTLEPFVGEAKRLVPVHEGFLRDSIVIGNKLTRNAKREDKREPREGVRVFAGTANRNGVPREFGATRDNGTHIAAEPFMRPAWEMTKDGMLDDLGDDLRVEIGKAAARAARKGRA